MSLTGKVSNVTIKNEGNSNDVKRFSNVWLDLSDSRDDPRLKITSPEDDNEVIVRAYLDECAYVAESSSPGKIECFRMLNEKKMVIIMDRDGNCRNILDRLRNYLTRNTRSRSRSRSRSSSPPRSGSGTGGSTPKPESRRDSSEKINAFIQALNSNQKDRAQKLAEDLARERARVGFALDLTNESGTQQPTPTPAPAPAKPLELKLSIESFLIEQCNDQKYDISILPGTKIADLKRLVQTQTNIRAEDQHWYFNRDNLPDDYEFGKSQPKLNSGKELVLFISKPTNN